MFTAQIDFFGTRPNSCIQWGAVANNALYYISGCYIIQLGSDNQVIGTRAVDDQLIAIHSDGSYLFAASATRVYGWCDHKELPTLTLQNIQAILFDATRQMLFVVNDESLEKHLFLDDVVWSLDDKISVGQIRSLIQKGDRLAFVATAKDRSETICILDTNLNCKQVVDIEQSVNYLTWDHNLVASCADTSFIWAQNEEDLGLIAVSPGQCLGNALFGSDLGVLQLQNSQIESSVPGKLEKVSDQVVKWVGRPIRKGEQIFVLGDDLQVIDKSFNVSHISLAEDVSKSVQDEPPLEVLPSSNTISELESPTRSIDAILRELFTETELSNLLMASQQFRYTVLAVVSQRQVVILAEKQRDLRQSEADWMIVFRLSFEFETLVDRAVWNETTLILYGPFSQRDIAFEKANIETTFEELHGQRYSLQEMVVFGLMKEYVELKSKLLGDLGDQQLGPDVLERHMLVNDYHLDDGLDLHALRALLTSGHEISFWAALTNHQHSLWLRLKPDTLTWISFARTGAVFWMEDDTLRTEVETLARTLYNDHDNHDPIACSVYYFALGKTKLMLNLWRQTTGHPEQAGMVRLLQQDFTQERWRATARKNAFALLSKRRYEYAVAFFVLAGAIQDAVTVCVQHLQDWALAYLIVRLCGSAGEREKILYMILDAHDDLWLTSWAQLELLKSDPSTSRDQILKNLLLSQDIHAVLAYQALGGTHPTPLLLYTCHYFWDRVLF